MSKLSEIEQEEKIKEAKEGIIRNGGAIFISPPEAKKKRKNLWVPDFPGLKLLSWRDCLIHYGGFTQVKERKYIRVDAVR